MRRFSNLDYWNCHCNPFYSGIYSNRIRTVCTKKNEEKQNDHIKREQAENISCWIETESEGGVWVGVQNHSKQPIYQVIINIVVISQFGQKSSEISAGQACLAVVPPGRGYINIGASHHGMGRRPGVKIAFKDVIGDSPATTAIKKP